MRADAEFFESTADPRVESIPLAHLSVEVGHFYAPDMDRDVKFFVDHFRRIGRWADVARSACQDSLSRKTARVSTCVLIDDYFGELDSPRILIPKLRAAARESGLTIDYLARESGCADPAKPAATDLAEPMADPPDNLSPAELVLARVVEDPPPETTGARPPVQQTGWLCNGQRSPSTDHHEAMKRAASWLPPSENAAVNHSIFADIELWRDGDNGRLWSCAMLAAVWQLLRLGVLRDNGRRLTVPQPLPDDDLANDNLPEDWRALPMVLQLTENPAPFSAYRTMTVCAPLFLPVENAVRTILQQVAVDPKVLEQIEARATDEKLDLPAAVVDRTEYLFVDTGPVRGAGPR
ncbi:SCO2522 family protein [Actinoplanes sp. GCM10030250]|uniref:SCO2522 family protein n=1 Tax=Actinoplanes sp. GCM10030250 TaxID=3273376 RepID=UPI0036221E84